MWEQKGIFNTQTCGRGGPLQSGKPMFYLGGVPRSVVQRERMEMSGEGIRGKSWTSAAPVIVKSELWDALMAAAFNKMCSRLVFVLQVKRNRCPRRYKP